MENKRRHLWLCSIMSPTRSATGEEPKKWFHISKQAHGFEVVSGPVTSKNKRLGPDYCMNMDHDRRLEKAATLSIHPYIQVNNHNI